MDEFGLIERLRRVVGSPVGVDTGIGDDAAVFDGRPGEFALMTTDMLVEGHHFFPDADLYDVGRKAMAVNVSDVAAMGGEPTYAVVALGVPEGLSTAGLARLYAGLRDEGSRWGAGVVGGDTVRAPVLVLGVTLLGRVQKDRVLRRRGALVGDKLAVTGRIGAAAAGLLLRSRPELDVPVDVRQRLGLALDRPVPRVAAGRELGRGLATAAIDVSDGIAGDVHRLCRASRVGARIDADALPIGDDVRRVADAAGVDAVRLALSGGEDYELLFTTSRQGTGRRLLARSRTSYTVIGDIVPAREGVSVLRGDGPPEPLSDAGFRHF